MKATIASSRGEDPLTLEVDLPGDTERLVLVDDSGNEYHFGNGAWTRRGTFLHVATYSPTNGLQRYAFFWEVADAIREGRIFHQAEPELGPKLSPRAVVALEGLKLLCNQSKGFHLEEKTWAVDTLRALWEGGRERYDAREVYVWAATHGWGIKDAEQLGKIADGVLQGKRFQGYDRRPIPHDPAKWRRMIDAWDQKAAESI